MKLPCLFSLSVLVLFSCTTQQKPISNSNQGKDVIVSNSPDIPGFNIEVPENSFDFEANREQILVTEKNSRIYIPSNAFESKKGEKVSGTVKVTFKEFHSSGEILASKLPMVYKNEKGEEINFESAGMFEIRAYQGGEELNLKEDKTIQIDLASTENGAYNFYSFNESGRNWNEMKTNCKPVPNKEKAKLQEELFFIENQEPEKPKKPIEYKEGDQLFDINIDYRNLDNQKLSDLNGVMWKLTEADTSQKKIESVLYNRLYSDVRLEPLENEELEFQIHMIQQKDTLSFKAAPVFKGKLLSRQKEKFKDLIANIQQNVKRSNQIKDQLKREKDLLRSFNVDQLGIYNYDRQFKDPGAIQILAEFSFEGDDKSINLQDVNVYLIPSSKKVVIRYTPETFELFAINPTENNKLLAVLPDNQVYYLSDKDIRSLNLLQYKDKKLNIELKKFKSVQKATQLDDLIASI